MNRLRFQFEAEEAAGIQGPELAATWGRLEIHAGDVVLTELHDFRSESVRRGISIPLYPLAEWLAANWWFLWFEEVKRPGIPAEERHSLGGAREGFALPALWLWPEGGEVAVKANPSTHRHAALRFLNGAELRVPASEMKAEAARLITAVLERLDRAGIHGTWLSDEWRMILEAEGNVADREFCEHAARLGLDPFDLPVERVEEIRDAMRSLPRTVTEDFFAVAAPEALAAEIALIRSFLDDVRSQRREWAPPRLPAVTNPSEAPHQQGYQEARELRRVLNLNGTRFLTLDDLLTRLQTPQPADFNGPAEIHAVTGVSANGTPVIGIRPARMESRLFAYCRALGESLTRADLEPVVVTPGRSARQKRSRAFAAEFLAPAHLIREELSSGGVGDNECDDIAAKFGVSSWVIRHQVENHGLGEYAGEIRLAQ